MVETSTVEYLFELAIAAEYAAEKLYRELMVRFVAYPEVCEFWKRMALEEVGHARGLERIRKNLTPEQLESPADPEMLKCALKALSVPLDRLLAQVTDLEVAYQLVSNLENSETNAVFEFLINHFAFNPELVPFFNNQLRAHLGALMEFSEQFGDESLRRRIKAAPISNSTSNMDVN